MNISVAIIGAGNLATHFVPALHDFAFLDVKYIVNRTLFKAKLLAENIEAHASSEISDIPTDIEVVFLMVNDDQIRPISIELSKRINNKAIIIHCSGTKKMADVSNYFENVGIIWPIYSFSQSDSGLTMRDAPLALLASNSYSMKILRKIACAISEKVYEMTEEQKEKMHLSAVIVNNFTNHLYHIGKTIVDKTNLPFGILQPIINQTAQKISAITPAEAQTGPALRKDKKTMQKHLVLLKEDPDLSLLYQILSKHIQKLNEK